MNTKTIRIARALGAAALLGLLAGCASYHAGTRYNTVERQRVRYLRAARVKHYTGGTWDLGVQVSPGPEGETIYLVLEHRSKSLKYIRAAESMIARAGGAELRLSVARGRNERRTVSGGTYERAFYPVTEEEYLLIANARTVEITIVTNRGFIRFPLTRPVQVDMLRFYQEEIKT